MMWWCVGGWCISVRCCMLKGICSRLCGVCVCLCDTLRDSNVWSRVRVRMWLRWLSTLFKWTFHGYCCQFVSFFAQNLLVLYICLCNYAKYITCYVASIQLEMRWNASQPATYTFESVCVRNIISLNGYGQMDIACDSEWTRIEMESANSCIRFDFQKKRDVLNIEHR